MSHRTAREAKLARRICTAFLAIFLTVSISLADDATFRRVKMVDAKGQQTKATLTFHDQDKSLVVQPVKGAAVTIPYDHADTFSYEYTKKHRVGVGAIVLLTVSVVGGIVVMCTQSTKHWLDIDYHDSGTPRNIVLRLDKHNYQRVTDAVKTRTGKDVEFLGCRLCKMKN